MPTAQVFQKDMAKGKGNHTESGIWSFHARSENKSGENNVKFVTILHPKQARCFSVGCFSCSSTFSSHTISNPASN